MTHSDPPAEHSSDSRPTPEVGLRVVHRRYVSHGHAHYAGSLVDGAFSLGLFGDAATELCILTDHDEGLFASYDDVQFRAAVRAGDVIEVVAELDGVGRRSRRMVFTASVVARDATPLSQALVVTTARGTVVVPARSGL